MVALVEAMLAFMALIAVAVLGSRPVIASICVGNWRFLGMSPLIIIAAMTTVTLIVLMAEAVLFYAFRATYILEGKNKYFVVFAVVSLIFTPYAILYLIVSSFVSGPFPGDEVVDLCSWAVGVSSSLPTPSPSV